MRRKTSAAERSCSHYETLGAVAAALSRRAGRYETIPRTERRQSAAATAVRAETAAKVGTSLLVGASVLFCDVQYSPAFETACANRNPQSVPKILCAGNGARRRRRSLCSHAGSRSSFRRFPSNRVNAFQVDPIAPKRPRQRIVAPWFSKTALAGGLLRSSAAERGELFAEVGVRADKSGTSGTLQTAGRLAVPGEIVRIEF
jgi:hypothetical protein